MRSVLAHVLALVAVLGFGAGAMYVGTHPVDFPALVQGGAQWLVDAAGWLQERVDAAVAVWTSR